MRIAVISAPARRSAPSEYAKALAKGMEKMGHQVELFDAWADDGMRLPGFEYIAMATETSSFFSAKISEAIPRILRGSSGIAGKKSAAFIKKGGIRGAKTLINVMEAMEKEGLVVNWSETLLSVPHAEAIGKQIGS